MRSNLKSSVTIQWPSTFFYDRSFLFYILSYFPYSNLYIVDIYNFFLLNREKFLSNSQNSAEEKKKKEKEQYTFWTIEKILKKKVDIEKVSTFCLDNSAIS